MGGPDIDGESNRVNPSTGHVCKPCMMMSCDRTWDNYNATTECVPLNLMIFRVLISRTGIGSYLIGRKDNPHTSGKYRVTR